MTASSSLARLHELPDIQATPDTRGLAIHQAGVDAYRFPATITDVDGRTAASLVSARAAVAVPAAVRGAHMSRLIATLDALSAGLPLARLPAIAMEVATRGEGGAAELELAFDWFVTKHAPVSGLPSLLDVQVRYRARVPARGPYQLVQHLSVPVTTLCPCSKAISRHGAHNQRATVQVELDVERPLPIAALVERVEAHGSCPVYGMLKRTDEKFVTERAYENPKFVEDVARDLYSDLATLSGVRRRRVRVASHESIHNHEAYAAIDDWLG